jgi:hypothetical protein
MTATVTGGPVTRSQAARRRFAFPRASTTPGEVRLIRMGMVIAWGLSRRLAEYR